MALPKLSFPIYTTTLPVTKEEVRFRPWLVGDKKALLVAMSASDPALIRNTTFDVIEKCLLDTPAGFVKKLPAVDVSWLVLQLRMRSDSDTIEFGLQINDCAKKGQCSQKIGVSLDSVEVVIDPNHVSKIMLTDTIGVKMREITMDLAQKYFALAETKAKTENEKLVELYFDMVAVCIESIFDADGNVYPADQVPRAELMEFISTMTDEQFAKLQNYLKTMPRLEKKIETKCRECGRVLSYTATGLDDFFG